MGAGIQWSSRPPDPHHETVEVFAFRRPMATNAWLAVVHVSPLIFTVRMPQRVSKYADGGNLLRASSLPGPFLVPLVHGHLEQIQS